MDLQPGNYVLEVGGLNVYYGSLHAVKDVSFKVHAGEIFDLPGPTGAGKTSTLSSIEGLLKPRSGSVVVAGYDTQEKPRHARAALGVQLQFTSFQPELTVSEIIQLYAGIYGVKMTPGRPFCTVGLMPIGLMGYSNSIARDRDKGIFQRLRVGPVATWSIMASRLTVQLMMILLLTVIVFLTAFYIDHVTLSPAGYAITFFTAIIGGAVYLDIGQVIVGLIKNPETVNSTTRLVYFVFIMVGMFGEFGILGKQVKDLAVWSPYGTVKHVLAAGMEPSKWNNDTSIALLLTIGYAIVFSAIGIKKFEWNNKYECKLVYNFIRATTFRSSTFCSITLLRF